MNAFKRKLDQSLPVEWVDDDEWNAIEGAFETAGATGKLVCSRADPSPGLPCPSKDRLTVSASSPGHQWSRTSSKAQLGLGFSACVQDSMQSDCNGVDPGEHGCSWRSLDISGNTSFDNIGGYAISVDQCSRIASCDSVLVTHGNRSASLPESPRQHRIELHVEGLEAATASKAPSGAPFPKPVPANVEPRSLESSKQPPARRLPRWMHEERDSLHHHLNNSKIVGRTMIVADPVTSHLCGDRSVRSASCNSTSPHTKQVPDSRQSSNLDGNLREMAAAEQQEELETAKLLQTRGQSNVIEGSPVQQAATWRPAHRHPQAGLPWGIDPSSYVGKFKPTLLALKFRGKVVYSKTESEVNEASLVLLERVKELQETTKGSIPMGFDLEWKPTFRRGEIPRKVAVLQICIDLHRCDVMHIIYSGIPSSLQRLLEEPSTVKVGVGVHGDAAKLQDDYEIVTKEVADLRYLANRKMGNFKSWSLSSLAQELTGKPVEKTQSIRCGNWEACPLSWPQLQYAATDAFASLLLYQVLSSFPDPIAEHEQGCDNVNS